MKWNRCAWLAVMLLVVAGTACAGPIADFFKKNPKPKPEDRVPQLLITVKTDRDEHKRSEAADELREYDPAVFFDIIPTLIDVLRNDPSASVRVDAAQSLAKFRPVSTEVGQALELAEKDSAMRVRIQARTSLVQYHLAGYHSPKKGDKPLPLVQTTEPPLAGPRQPAPPNATPLKPVTTTPQVPGTITIAPASGESTTSGVPQKMPTGPAPLPKAPELPGKDRAPVQPSDLPQLELPPQAPSAGPELGSPAK